MVNTAHHGLPMLRPGTGVRRGIEVASRDGAAFVASALGEHALASISRELAPARFGKLAGREGRARQEGEILVLTGPLRGYPAIRQLRGELVAAARGLAAAIPGLEVWDPDEVAVQRYHAGALGITPHLDLKRYGYLVAVATVHGSAAFTWCRNRDGDPLATWQAGPGSLVLLRGPGLGGTPDSRPLHAVSGPVTGQRISLGFRMNTRASVPGTPAVGAGPASDEA